MSEIANSASPPIAKDSTADSTAYFRDMKIAEQEKVHLTAEIERQRLRLNNIISNVPGIVWESHFVEDGFEQKIGFVSKYVQKMTGYTVKDWLETSDFWFQIIHPEDKEEVERSSRNFSSNDESITQQYRWIRKDGEIIWVETQMILIRDENGKPVILRGVTTDITERKVGETAIIKANKHSIYEYERLLDRIAEMAESLGSARDLITVYRALYSFTIVSAPCNGFFISLYDAEQKLRFPEYARTDGEEFNVSHLPPMKMTESPNSRAISTGTIIIEDDFQAAMAGKPIVNIGLDKHPDLPQSCLVAPMSVMGRVVGAVEVQSTAPAAYTKEHATAMRMAANLTANAIENVRLLERERESAEQRRQSQKLESVGRLAGGIAHDFNNMLTAINGYSDLTLRRLDADNPLRRNVEEIKKAGERSAALTHQLLAFSRQQVLKPKLLDLNEVMMDTGRLLNRLIGEDIQLDFLPASDLGFVKADPGQLTQVIMNLVVNARDAMPKGGSITIKTSNVYLDAAYAKSHFPTQIGSYVLLSIGDTGKGMSDDIKQRIFEPFYTTKKTGEGTGLGLATVYGIIKQSEGYIWADSEIGKGTTFDVYLPRVEAEVESSAENKLSDKIQGGTETILLVEDEDMVRNLSRQILEICGYQVIEARNGIEALTLSESRNQKIDLLLTDVVMPQMGGRELMEKLSTLHPGISVLFTSGYTDDAVLRQGVQAEDMNFIQKPFTLDALAHKVRKCLDNKT